VSFTKQTHKMKKNAMHDIFNFNISLAKKRICYFKHEIDYHNQYCEGKMVK